MTLSITKTAATLRQAAADADLNLNSTLTTQEVKRSLDAGVVTKAQRDVLASLGAKAASGGLHTSNYGLWLDRYIEAAVAADQAGNRNGRLEAGEATAAPSTFRTADGTSLSTVRTVLSKLAKVSAEPPPAFDASVAANRLNGMYAARSPVMKSLPMTPDVAGLKRFTVSGVASNSISDSVTSAVGYIDPVKEQVFFNVNLTEKLPWENITTEFSEWFSVPFANVQ